MIGIFLVTGVARMLYGLIVTLFVINALILILLVLIQKTKSSMGLGSMGGGSQMLFGGSSGQDFLQKATWALGFSLLFLSFAGAILRNKLTQTSRYVSATVATAPAAAAPTASTPAGTASAESAVTSQAPEAANSATQAPASTASADTVPAGTATAGTASAGSAPEHKQ